MQLEQSVFGMDEAKTISRAFKCLCLNQFYAMINVCDLNSLISCYSSSKLAVKFEYFAVAEVAHPAKNILVVDQWEKCPS